MLPATFARTIQRVEPNLALEALGDITAAHAFAARSIDSEPVLAHARDMQLDPAEPLAQRLLVVDDVLDPSPRMPAEGQTAVEPVRFQAAALVERHTSVSLRYQSNVAGYLRLAYSHAPFGRMEIDGERVPFSRDALGAIVVRAPAGAHQLRWSVGVSRLRAWMMGISGLALLLLSAWLIRSRRVARPAA